MKTILILILALTMGETLYAAESAVPAGAPPTAPAAATPAAGQVTRAQFTTGVRNHEPVDDITRLSDRADKVYFFTEVRDMAGGMVIHEWLHDGKVMAKVPFEIHGPRWRVWSSKRLSPRSTGTWEVQVFDGAGKRLADKRLQYTAVTEGKAPAAPAPSSGHSGSTNGP